MIKKIFILFIVLSGFLFPQNVNKAELDSLFNLFVSFKTGITSQKLEKQLNENPAASKCGFHAVNFLQSNFELLSPDQQTLLEPLLQRPSLPLSIVSPSGFFRVHYDPIGTNAPAYDINLLAEALDSAYNFEVNYLGYPAPPPDGSEGGDEKFDVYIQNIGSLYGYTQFESSTGSTNWTSFIVIDNDFSGFYTTGINGGRVTAAHEFHHAIQGGSYGIVQPAGPVRDADVFFYEITSTAMEEFVYNSINDYYAYMLDYFRIPSRSMPLNNGYNLAIWNIFLKERFGFAVLKRQWELIPTTPALRAIAISLNELQTSFGNELNKFGVWSYYTNSRAIQGRYFPEANFYPLLLPTANVSFSSGSQTYNMSVQPSATYFLNINLPAGDGNFLTIISNSDYQKAIDNPNQTLDFAFTIFDNPTSGQVALNSSYSVTFNRNNQTFWNNSGILNDVVVYGDSFTVVIDIDKEVFSYPSPFKYSSYSQINIVFENSEISSDEVDFNVYTSAMELVFYDKKIIERAFTQNSKQYSEISWNVKDESGNKLPSGVYLFVLKVNDKVKKGKAVIFNE